MNDAFIKLFGENKKKEKKEVSLSVEHRAVCVSNRVGRWFQQPVLPLQSCLSGYYRVDGILFGGICQPCECHGHAAECDFQGVCFVSLSKTFYLAPPPSPTPQSPAVQK